MFICITRKFWVFFILIYFTLFLPFSVLADEELIETTVLNEFLDDFYMNLQRVAETGDSSLSERTNLEIKTRKWNDYLTNILPRRIKVRVPVDEVSLGKETFNRSTAEIKFDFKLDMPQQYFQYQNNIGGKIFGLLVTEFTKNDKKWIQIQPEFNKFQVESDKARKLEVLNKHGYLIFEITMSISREAGWLHYYQTVFGIESVQWLVENELLWKLDSLPFEDILNREKQ
jgi:hypothetical protein